MSTKTKQPTKQIKDPNQVSAWGYWGYDLLWAIPLIGTIFLIIHAMSRDNIARRNYARSKFIPFLIWGVAIVGLCLFALIIYAKNGWL